ncbi:acyl-CoA N-acyltransferase [Podospora conica]|nr:acyl-CoA N-acyltransferase [Schizothecium conicum]
MATTATTTLPHLDLINPLRDASRKLVREWGFLQPTFTNSLLSPAAVHLLLEIGDNNTHDIPALLTTLNTPPDHLHHLLSSLTSAGHITATATTPISYYITPLGQRTLLAINHHAQAQISAALSTAPATAAQDITTTFRLYTSALAAARTTLTPEASRPTSPTPLIPSAAPTPLIPIPTPPTISRGYTPSLLSSCLSMHMAFYPPLNNWGLEFEAGLGALLADLLLRLDRPVNEAFYALQDGRIVGTVFIDGEGERGPQLRAFIVDDAARGTGVGRRLFEEAMGFVKERGFGECRLVTMRRLEAARRLYESGGFRLVKEEEKVCWGVRLGELEYLWTREADVSEG